MALPLPLFHVEDNKSTGTDGGSTSASTLQIRVINTTKVNEITDASLGSNQITLPAGTYWIEAYSATRGSGRTALHLWNDSDSSFEILGLSNYGRSSGVGAVSTLRGRFTIAGTKNFELQQWTHEGLATTGLGLASDDGETEVYLIVTIRQLNGDELDSMHVQDEIASGTNGGSSSGGSFNTRDLSTEKHNTITGASLAANQITLPAGTYFVEAVAAFFDQTSDVNLVFRDTTGSVYVAQGVNESGAANFGGNVHLAGQFVITAESVFELQQYLPTTEAGTGWGLDTIDTETNIFCDVVITKLA